MKVVIDTNVFLSGLFWEGNESRIIDLCMDRVIINHTSQHILDEVRRVLGYDKFNLTENEINRLISIFLSFSCFIEPNVRVEFVKDYPTENRFIECALSSSSSYLISGDKHLLDLRLYKGIIMIKPIRFITIMKKGKPV